MRQLNKVLYFAACGNFKLFFSSHLHQKVHKSSELRSRAKEPIGEFSSAGAKGLSCNLVLDKKSGCKIFQPDHFFGPTFEKISARVLIGLQNEKKTSYGWAVTVTKLIVKGFEPWPFVLIEPKPAFLICISFPELLNWYCISKTIGWMQSWHEC